jgi:hypothetical protein
MRVRTESQLHERAAFPRLPAGWLGGWVPMADLGLRCFLGGLIGLAVGRIAGNLAPTYTFFSIG